MAHSRLRHLVGLPTIPRSNFHLHHLQTWADVQASNYVYLARKVGKLGTQEKVHVGNLATLT